MTLNPSRLSSCCESTGRGTLAESWASCPQRAEGPLPGEPLPQQGTPSCRGVVSPIIERLRSCPTFCSAEYQFIDYSEFLFSVQGSAVALSLSHGIRRPLFTHPYAGPLPSIHDSGYRVRTLIACLAGLRLLDRRTHVLRRQPFQYLRRLEQPRRAPRIQREKLRPELPGIPVPMQVPKLPHAHRRVAFGLPLVGVGDLHLHHQVWSDTLDVGVDGRFPWSRAA